jgi:biopolymer transport protein ExbB/TolQ
MTPRIADFRWLLLTRFLLINGAGAALLSAAWVSGSLDDIIATDTTRLCALIFAVFVAGLGIAAYRVCVLSDELNRAPGSKASKALQAMQRTDSTGRASIAAALRLKLAQRAGTLRWVSGTLVMLGLIGTVVGFMIALSGVDADTAGDVAAIGPMVSALIEGLGVALTTTLVGSVLSIWTVINCRLVEGASVQLLTRVVEQGEALA